MKQLHILCFLLIIAAQARADQWLPVQNSPLQDRRSPFTFTIGNKGYVGGGMDANGTFRKDFWEYDPVTNTWTQRADFGGGKRFQAVGFALNGKGYVGLGLMQDTFLVLKQDMWEYDPEGDTWIQKNNFGGEARRQALAFTIGNDAYIGWGNKVGYCFPDFWKYDPAQDSWTQHMSFSGFGRRGGIAFSINGKGYVGTGYCYGGSDFFNDLWEYDPITEQWIEKANLPNNEWWYNAVGYSLGSKGYIVTGYSDEGFLTKLWEYNPTIDVWTQKSDFAGDGRNEAAAFVIGDKAYVGLGFINGVDVWDLQGATFFNDFYSYTPDTETSINALVDGTSVSIYPNPSQSETTLRCELPSSTDVRIELTDLSGRRILTQDYFSQSAGVHSFNVDTKRCSPGVYLLNTTIGNNKQVFKVVKQ